MEEHRHDEQRAGYFNAWVHLRHCRRHEALMDPKIKHQALYEHSFRDTLGWFGGGGGGYRRKCPTYFVLYFVLLDLPCVRGENVEQNINCGNTRLKISLQPRLEKARCHHVHVGFCPSPPACASSRKAERVEALAGWFPSWRDKPAGTNGRCRILGIQWKKK